MKKLLAFSEKLIESHTMVFEMNKFISKSADKFIDCY